MCWKKEFIERHGEEAYIKELGRRQAWNDAHSEIVKRRRYEQNRKGGKYYVNAQKYSHSGLQGARNVVRNRHSRRWRPFKSIVAQDSQIHHEWVLGTANYKGVALVEANAHMHGFVNVIEIVKGKITVFTERELRERGDVECQ